MKDALNILKNVIKRINKSRNPNVKKKLRDILFKNLGLVAVDTLVSK